MTSTFDRLQRWSWHQSHDQATVLLLVPADITIEELSIHLDARHLIVSVRSETAAIKGCLYGSINVKTSSWQLERSFNGHHQKGGPGTGGGGSSRGKTRTASTSAGSSGSSSYAVLTDPDISSSFANSLANDTDFETMTDTDQESATSRRHHNHHHQRHQSPSEESHDEEEEQVQAERPPRERLFPPTESSSRAASPPEASMASSVSSSVHSFRPIRGLSRLLTIHLDKVRQEIWPVLIVTGVSKDVEQESQSGREKEDAKSDLSSSSVATILPSLTDQKYNMDPTSLVGAGLMALHESIEGAFEYFCRAWLLDHNPVAAMKLATIYLPLQTTPQRSAIIPSERGYSDYLRRLGGNAELAKIYLEVGILYLEGLGSTLASSTTTLAHAPFALGLSEFGPGTVGADPDTAQRYFRRARTLDPSIEVPDLRSTREPLAGVDLVMPSLDVGRSASTIKDDEYGSETSFISESARRRKARRRSAGWDEREEWSALYLPGLVGATVALGVVGVLSVNWWRSSSR